MCEANSIIQRWERSGLRSLEAFDLSDHYTALFDDETKGIDHIFESFSIDKDRLINANDHEVIRLLRQIDDDMRKVTTLVQEFITENLLGKIECIEEVCYNLGVLKICISEKYENIADQLRCMSRILKTLSDRN